MTHGKDCPTRCSQCLGIPARQVTQRGAELLIDGEPSGRTIDDERRITVDFRRRKR